MINEQLDFGPSAAILARDGFVQIDGFLSEGAARSLHACLTRQVCWDLAYRDLEGPKSLPHDAPASAFASAIEAAIAAGRADRFAFAYERYPMVTAYTSGRDPGLLLHRVLELFNTPQYHAFMARLSGLGPIHRIDAQATRYRAGHFLRRHDDSEQGERLFAYVLNLTDAWHSDYGGLLQVVDEADRVRATLMPRFNCLTLFRVPLLHQVSYVAPYAVGERLAITGWAYRASGGFPRS